MPTATFRVLTLFFVIHHERRRVLPFAITDHPHAEWVVQQLRETFPYDRAPRYVILDRDGKYGDVVSDTLRSWGVEPNQTTARSPWQNGISASWVLSTRRELLDHVVVMGANHLHRLLTDYVAYYLEDRCHLALDKDAPVPREVTPRPSPTAEVVALPFAGLRRPPKPIFDTLPAKSTNRARHDCARIEFSRGTPGRSTPEP